MDTNDDDEDDEEDASNCTIHEDAPPISSWVGNTDVVVVDPEDDEDVDVDDDNGSMTNLSNNPPYRASLLIAPFFAKLTSDTTALIISKLKLGKTL